ncbi:MAG: hypothetical protein WEB06_13050 [Actinomycetota bacterium]
MAEPPEIEVVAGSPTPEEEAAIREAILRIWRKDQSEAQRVSGRSRWVVAARADSSGWGAADVRGSDAWRLALRLPGLGLVSVRRSGRGDSK